MKNTIIIYFLIGISFLQAQDCRDISLYNKYVDIGKELVEQGDYVKALEYYASAKDFCSERITEVDELITDIVKRISQEQEDIKIALQQAEQNLIIAREMQRKMELAVFDKAIKEKLPKWKGFKNYNYDDRRQLLNQVDSLDLRNNALVSLPLQLQECTNLKHLDLLGNIDIIPI